MNLKAEKIKISVKEALSFISRSIKERGGWILSLIFLLVIGYSTYLWYIYAFNPSWSESKKQEYIKTKQKDASFDKDRFDSVISEIKQRKLNSQKNIADTPDIFRFK